MPHVDFGFVISDFGLLLWQDETFNLIS